MAIHTDFFLASQDELQVALPLRLLPSAGPPWRSRKRFTKAALSADFPTIEECEAIKQFESYPQKNLLPDCFEELNFVLGGDGDEFTAALYKPPLMVPGDDPFAGLFQFPQEFVRALAAIPDGKIPSIAEEWLGHKKASATLGRLCKMSRAAIDANKNLYLWMVI